MSPAFLHDPETHVTQALAEPAVFDLTRRVPFSLIVLELSSPPDAGLVVCRRLKADSVTETTPLIVVAPDEARHEAALAGAEVVIGKPILQREYYEAVARFLDLPQRRAPRHPVNVRFYFEGHGDAGQAFSRDLSLCGAFLKSDRQFPSGTLLRVRFALPGTPAPLCCEALVRQGAPTADAPSAGAGFAIEFRGIAGTDLEALERFLSRKRRGGRAARFGFGG